MSTSTHKLSAGSNELVGKFPGDDGFMFVSFLRSLILVFCYCSWGVKFCADIQKGSFLSWNSVAMVGHPNSALESLPTSQGSFHKPRKSTALKQEKLVVSVWYRLQVNHFQTLELLPLSSVLSILAWKTNLLLRAWYGCTKRCQLQKEWTITREQSMMVFSCNMVIVILFIKES